MAMSNVCLTLLYRATTSKPHLTYVQKLTVRKPTQSSTRNPKWKQAVRVATQYAGKSVRQIGFHPSASETDPTPVLTRPAVRSVTLNLANKFSQCTFSVVYRTL